MASVSVIARFTFEGVHSWPDCPEGGPTPYLRHPHRHLFHVEAVKPVAHDERDVEFIALRRHMLAFCEVQLVGPHHLSCESMARQLLGTFGLSRCSVSEDGENGAEVCA